MGHSLFPSSTYFSVLLSLLLLCPSPHPSHVSKGLGSVHLSPHSTNCTYTLLTLKPASGAWPLLWALRLSWVSAAHGLSHPGCSTAVSKPNVQTHCGNPLSDLSSPFNPSPWATAPITQDLVLFLSHFWSCPLFHLWCQRPLQALGPSLGSSLRQLHWLQPCLVLFHTRTFPCWVIVPPLLHIFTSFLTGRGSSSHLAASHPLLLQLPFWPRRLHTQVCPVPALEHHPQSPQRGALPQPVYLCTCPDVCPLLFWSASASASKEAPRLAHGGGGFLMAQSASLPCCCADMPRHAWRRASVSHWFAETESLQARTMSQSLVPQPWGCALTPWAPWWAVGTCVMHYSLHLPLFMFFSGKHRESKGTH